MRAVSRKRARQLREYAVLRLAFLEERLYCERPRCPQFATEVHHKRGRVGALLLATEHWLAVCRGCHAWITENPAKAYELGLSEHRVGAA